jgi:PAS domain S-box-containing protein
MKSFSGKTGVALIPETDPGTPMHKNTQNRSCRKENNEYSELQRNLLKLLILHRKLVALEKLDIRSQRSSVCSEEIEERCHKIFNKSKDCIAVLQDRKIVCISSALTKLLGYSRKEMLRTSLASYIHPQELFKVVGYYLSRISGGDAPSIYETIIKRKDGKDIHVELMAGLFPFFGKPADLVMVSKIAE